MSIPFQISDEIKKALSHVLWIGGATDAGKTTVTQNIAERHHLQLYHYDRHDAAHHERLIETSIRTPKTLEESWIHPTPIELLQGCMQGFIDRLPLMIEDLIALPKDSIILAEGFGLTPALIAPLLSDSRKVVFLFPTATFKYESMERRQKLSVLGEKAELARKNLFIRDVLLADRLKSQARANDFTIFEIDGTVSIEQMTDLIENHFEKFLYHS